MLGTHQIDFLNFLFIIALVVLFPVEVAQNFIKHFIEDGFFVVENEEYYFVVELIMI